MEPASADQSPRSPLQSNAVGEELSSETGGTELERAFGLWPESQVRTYVSASHEEATMSYPATIDARTPEQLDRWRPLVQWILAIPHLIIAWALEYVTGAVAVVSWFVILFTGRLPAGLANFQVMILRYTTRAETYAGFLFDDYPAFDFTMSADEPGGSPLELQVEPALGDRNRLTVGLRILWCIPALLYAVLIAIVGIVCWFLAFFAVLFTGRWPEALRSWVMKMLRVSTRLNAYILLLTDEYPPFATD